MDALLDTHTAFWAAVDPDRLTASAARALRHPDGRLFLSIVSVWELAIKTSLGKLRLDMSLATFVASAERELGTGLLPVSTGHCATVQSLPFHHRDPFDRLLVAQALTEGLAIISADPAFDAYGVRRVW